jgi:hypothetical protein
VSPFLTILLLLWMSSSPALAQKDVTHWYVSPVGKDSNPCTKEAPCYSLRAAGSHANPGDTIHAAPGNYTYDGETRRLPGTGIAGAPISYVSDVKWEAKITTSESGNTCVLCTGGDYQVIKNFDISGPSGAGIGIFVNNNHIKVIGNKIHDITNRCNPNGVEGVQIYQDNYDALVSGNIVYNIDWPETECRTTQGIYLAGGVPMLAENNIVWHSGTNGILISCRWKTTSGNGKVVINNLTFLNANNGIIIACDGSGRTDYNVVQNNMSFYNGLYQKGKGQWGCGIGTWGGTSSGLGTNTYYLNNMTYGNPGGDYCQPLGQVSYAVTNVDPAAGSIFSRWDRNGIHGDYHLARNSPAIGKGSTLNHAPDFDFDEKPRPTPPSVGPYEPTSINP